jgi:hypothetical protein
MQPQPLPLTFNSGPGILGSLGYVGVFLCGMAALGYVIVWVVKTLRGTVLLPTSSAPPTPSDAELRLFIMGAVTDLKFFIEAKAQQNRHDARNVMTAVADKVAETGEKVAGVTEQLDHLTQSADRLEGYLQRWRPPT